jgi:3-dehydroquinate dehydratase type I
LWVESITAQICATVVGRDVEAIRSARQAAESDADLVELRLDSMVRPDPDGALAGRLKPAVVTCRPLREGGLFDGSEEERLRVLMRAHDLGAEFIDVEWDAAVDPLIRTRRGRGVIVSRHDFSGTPADVAATMARLRSRGGEIAKLAVTTERPSDLLSLLAAAPGLRREFSPTVLDRAGPTPVTRSRRDRSRRPGCSRNSASAASVATPRSTW